MRLMQDAHELQVQRKSNAFGITLEETEMTTNNELALVEEQVTESTQKSDSIELSLGDLDMVGGGAVAIVFA